MRTHQGIACVRPRNSDGLVALLFGSFLPLHRSPISVSTCRTSASLSVMSYVVRCGGRHYTTQHRNFLLSRERSGVSRIAVTQRCAWNSVQGSRAPVRFVLVDEVFKNIGHAKRRDRPRIETRPIPRSCLLLGSNPLRCAPTKTAGKRMAPMLASVAGGSPADDESARGQMQAHRNPLEEPEAHLPLREP